MPKAAADAPISPTKRKSSSGSFKFDALSAVIREDGRLSAIGDIRPEDVAEELAAEGVDE